jgi:hypothetical protein
MIKRMSNSNSITLDDIITLVNSLNFNEREIQELSQRFGQLRLEDSEATRNKKRNIDSLSNDMREENTINIDSLSNDMERVCIVRRKRQTRPMEPGHQYFTRSKNKEDIERRKREKERQKEEERQRIKIKKEEKRSKRLLSKSINELNFDNLVI